MIVCQKKQEMKSQEFLMKSLRELYTRVAGFPENRAIDTERVQYIGSAANDYIYQRVSDALRRKEGFALCKLGTVELGAMISYLFKRQGGLEWNDYKNFIKGYPVPLFYEKEILRLVNNAGVFPATPEIIDRFCAMMIEDLPYTDVLASYAWCERYILPFIQESVKVDLEGYYAPFLYEHPWSRVLENKRILVIHPFANSIARQYERRQLLFDNPDVLPQFGNLRIIKAVQSIAGNDCGFNDWFEAFEYMKTEMEREDFDVALIGCGAYGFPLTLHAKRIGKIGIHLAGWLQMLFGVYGKRWLADQPKYAKFTNESWIRPDETERPQRFNQVEGGCYW